MVITIIPLILGVSFGVMSAALHAYRTIDARSNLSSQGTHILEIIGQDVRGLSEVYSTSSKTRLHGRVYGRAADIDYEFIEPTTESPGVLTRNEKDIIESGASVTACEFDYLKPIENDGPVPPDSASCIKVRLTLESGTLSMSFESIFYMRNS